MKRIRISSSIANFHDRLRARYSDYGDFKWFSKDPTIFFGMYHWGDYLRLFLHRGPAKIFWCGSDILNLPKPIAYLIRHFKHVCENTVEQNKLSLLGIYAEIHPMIFDDPGKYQITYEHSSEPEVWFTGHSGRVNEYGLNKLIPIANSLPEITFNVFGVERPPAHTYIFENVRLIGPYFPSNIIFRGMVSRELFDSITANYQATIRFNEFDGFSENLAKAMLRGQYAFSVIPYPDIETVTDDASLIASLKDLKNKHQPHDTSYWREQLSKRVEV